MSKIIIISTTILVTGISVFILFSTISTNETEPGNQFGDTELPDQDSVNNTPPVGNEFESSIENGSVTVMNRDGLREDIIFLGDSAEDEEVLAEGLSLLFESDPNASYFDIMYDRPSGTITVYLHELPLSFARNMAISRLTDSLQVTTSDLCDLNISVQTNVFVDQAYAGRELGVPGCPDAINLPV